MYVEFYYVYEPNISFLFLYVLYETGIIILNYMIMLNGVLRIESCLRRIYLHLNSFVKKRRSNLIGEVTKQ